MGKAVPIEVRETIVRARRLDGKLTYEDIAQMCGVGAATVSRVLTKNRRGESLLPKARGGARVVKIGPEGRLWLARRLDEEPDLTMSALADLYAQAFGVKVGRSTVGDAIAAMNYTRKKSRSQPHRRTVSG